MFKAHALEFRFREWAFSKQGNYTQSNILQFSIFVVTFHPHPAHVHDDSESQEKNSGSIRRAKKAAGSKKLIYLVVFESAVRLSTWHQYPLTIKGISTYQSVSQWTWMYMQELMCSRDKIINAHWFLWTLDWCPDQLETNASHRLNY